MSYFFLAATSLASEGAKADGLWDPMLRGLLVLAFAVLLFCGSVYLLLGTNLGARLGFLVTFSGLMGFMTLLSLFWATTATPITSLHGEEKHWEVKEVIEGGYGASSFQDVRTIERTGEKSDDAEANEIRATVDTALAPPDTAPEEEKVNQKFQDSSQYVQVGSALRIGGGRSSLVRNRPLYAVMTVQQATKKLNVIGEEEPTKDADPTKPLYSVILVRNLGSMRLPPIVTFLGSALLFGLSLLALHWHEQNQREAAATASPATA